VEVYMPFKAPTNSAEWWELLSKSLGDRWAGLEATAEIILGESYSPGRLTQLTKARDTEAYHLLHSIWDKAPDRPEIHELPCWDVLCDLLSESYCIQEELEQSEEDSEVKEPEGCSNTIQNEGKDRYCFTHSSHTNGDFEPKSSSYGQPIVAETKNGGKADPTATTFVRCRYCDRFIYAVLLRFDP